MYLIPTWSKLLGIGIGEIDRKSRHSDVRWYGMVWYSIYTHSDMSFTVQRCVAMATTTSEGND